MTGGAGSCGEILGVTREHVARIHDGTFLYRCGHHGRKLSVHAAVAGAVQHREHVGCVVRIQHTGLHRLGGGNVQHLHGAGHMSTRRQGGVVARDAQRKFECGRRLFEHRGVAGDDQLRRPRVLRQEYAGIRTDARRLTRGNDNPRGIHLHLAVDEQIEVDGQTEGVRHHYILTSTKASSRRRRSHNSVSSSALLSRIAAKACWRRTSSVLS